MKLFALVSSLLAIAGASSKCQNAPYSSIESPPLLEQRGLSPDKNNNNTRPENNRVLSHVVGVQVKPQNPLLFGPDLGAAQSPPNTVRVSYFL